MAFNQEFLNIIVLADNSRGVFFFYSRGELDLHFILY